MALNLLVEVQRGGKQAVEALLEAGVCVNGGYLQPPPVVLATLGKDIGMVQLLIANGADVNAPSRSMPGRGHVCGLVVPKLKAEFDGQSALHFAAWLGCMGTLRVLLNAGAEPNVIDAKGRTPLMLATEGGGDGNGVKIGQELFKAGADSSLMSGAGQLALHVAARKGRVDMVALFLSEAPETLSCNTAAGETPLYIAAHEGHEGVVLYLLSVAKKNHTSLGSVDMCPLVAAVVQGHAKIVRVLLDERGMEVIRTPRLQRQSIFAAVLCGRVDILRQIVDADAEEGKGRAEWEAPCISLLGDALHIAVRYSVLKSVNILLAAGVDERWPAMDRRLPRDTVGIKCEVDPPTKQLVYVATMASLRADNDWGNLEESSIRRMLERGPAFRARSWLWPADTPDAAAAQVHAVDVPLSLKPTPTKKNPLGASKRAFPWKKSGTLRSNAFNWTAVR